MDKNSFPRKDLSVTHMNVSELVLIKVEREFTNKNIEVSKDCYDLGSYNFDIEEWQFRVFDSRCTKVLEWVYLTDIFK